MYTQCPECDTVFRVTAVVLRTARGRVRCGVCDATFDALEFLSEGVEFDLPGAAGVQAPPPDSGAGATAHPGGAAAPVSMAGADAPPWPAPGGAAPGFAALPAVAMAVAAEAASLLDEPFAPPPAVARAAPNDDFPEVAAELDLDGADPVETAATDDADRAVRAAPEPPEPMPGLDDSIEVQILDPAIGEEIVLEGTESAFADVPDAALESDATRTPWREMFVGERAAPTSPPLEPVPVPARAGAASDAGADTDRARDAECGFDDLEVELAALDAAGRADPAPRLLDAEESERVTAPGDDPLARTDESPPLQLSDAEAAELWPFDPAPVSPPVASIPQPEPMALPAPAPRPAAAAAAVGVRPEDFDALVAAAATRAAAAVTATLSARVLASDRTAAANDATRVPLEAAHPTGSSKAAGPAVGTPAFVDAEPESEIIEFDERRFQAVTRSGGGQGWWATALLGVGVGVLTLGLVAQLVHWNRDSLSQDALVGALLGALYARLGVPLEPHWNLAEYDLRQWGAGSDAAPGTLRVRASVVNRAPRAQPYPWLRVTLEDRHGAQVARREFSPEEYLPSRALPPQPLAPNARADADLLIADPGSEAVGFELDVCLRRRGVLTCSEELRFAQTP